VVGQSIQSVALCEPPVVIELLYELPDDTGPSEEDEDVCPP